MLKWHRYSKAKSETLQTGHVVIHYCKISSKLEVASKTGILAAEEIRCVFDDIE